MVDPVGSATATVKGYVPAAVGVPVKLPPADRASPGGNVPAATEKVSGPVGPVAVRVWV